MLQPIQPILEYYVNQDYIAEFLCINKDKPEMHCNGKCYLMKEMGKQHQENNTRESLGIQLNNYPIGFVSIFSLNGNKELKIYSRKIGNTYKNNYSYLFHYSSFHPPKV